MHLGRVDDAKAALDALHPLTDDARIAVLKARIGLGAGDGVDAKELEARIDGNPADLEARLALARHHARTQAFEAALQQLLEIVRRDRKFGDDAGRRTMLEMFDLLGADHDLVSKYRRMLAAALY